MKQQNQRNGLLAFLEKHRRIILGHYQVEEVMEGHVHTLSRPDPILMGGVQKERKIDSSCILS